MEQRILGGTGVSVSVLGFGAMNLGAWGNVDQAGADTLVGEALDAGVNLFDTADIYSFGESETLLGKALGSRRDKIVLATKGRNSIEEDPLHGGASRRWIVRAVEDSLRRLGTDYIDLYQIHRPDWATDQDETLSALTDLQRAGKILSFGSSTFPAHTIVQGQWIAKENGLSRYTTEQVTYSIFSRAIEADVLPLAQQYKLGILVWSPLANGWLAGTVRRDQPITAHRSNLAGADFDLSVPENARKLDIVDELRKIADDLGISLPELGLAFAKSHPAVSTVLIGPRTVEHLRQNLRSAEIVLDTETLDRIDAIVEPGTDVSPRDRYPVLPPNVTDPRLRRIG
ncbi:aldo/keto reductase [Pseudonocardia halophobica]|uniref:Aldo/keto reductase n=1 Tax=Pseudonocardia halophobica TaxID=29401 RepID=A0A9W6L1I1_9PSEU|nr:aldo/keto reductase [Pseudonocardia halophobica]GLL10519.1 aldo/keto reductase [Pseudonocardia halophobica]